jgi:hypothetical protein
LDDVQAVVAFNVSKVPQTVSIKLDSLKSLYTQAWPDNGGSHQINIKELTLTIPPRDALMLIG